MVPMSRTKALMLLISAPFLVLGSACAPYQAGARTITVINQAPPPPAKEVISAQPYIDAVWVAGYWYWAGSRYAWVSGRWITPPGQGMVWYVGGYSAYGSGYIWSSGYWGYMDHHPTVVYVHHRPHPRHYHRGRRYSNATSRRSSHAARPGRRSHVAGPASRSQSSPSRRGRVSAPSAGSQYSPMTMGRKRRDGRGNAPAASPPRRRGRSSAPPAGRSSAGRGSGGGRRGRASAPPAE